MTKKSSSTLTANFQNLPDPRVERTKPHLLVDIIAIAICAGLCRPGRRGFSAKSHHLGATGGAPDEELEGARPRCADTV
jgi:hypothetical protein